MPLKIKSQTVYTAYIAISGINAGELEEKVFMESRVLYNEKGKVVTSSRYLPSGKTETSVEIKYDENNNAIEELYFISENEISEKKVFRYENNLPVEEQLHYLDNSFDKIIYLYDEKKLLTEKRAFEDETCLDYRVEFHYKDGFLSEIVRYDPEENITEKETYSRDAKGNVLEKTIACGDEITEVILNQYDDRGRLTRTARKNNFEKSETLYSYDPAGNVIEESLYSGGKIMRKTAFVYDENNLLKEMLESVTVPGLSTDQEIRKKVEYEFY